MTPNTKKLLLYGGSISAISILVFLNVLAINNIYNLMENLALEQPGNTELLRAARDNINLAIARAVIAIGAVSFMLWALNHEILRREKAEQKSRQLNIELELRVQQRTIELEQALQETSRAKDLVDVQISRLKSLREIDLAILGSNDLYLPLKTVISEAFSELEFDAASIHLFNPNAQTYKYVVGQGFRTRNIYLPTKIEQRLAARAIREMQIQHAIYSVEDSPIAGEDFVESYALPLMAKGYINGVLEIFYRQPCNPPVSYLDFMSDLAGQASIAIAADQLFHKLQTITQELLQAYDETIEGWSYALELRDSETKGHSQRVMNLTLHMASMAGISDEDLIHVRRGALLHDIGKMSIPDSILLKPGPLTEEERKVIEKHPVFAFNMLSPIDYLHPALDIPYCHHEKWDGSGYPRGLKDKQIPLAARLFAVVDVWDALRSDRPYRKAWSDEEALKHIKQLAGTHFDSQVLEYFLNVIDKD